MAQGLGHRMEHREVAAEGLHRDELARVGLVRGRVRIGLVRQRVDGNAHARSQRRDAPRIPVHRVVDRIEDVLPRGSGGIGLIAAIGEMAGN
ncbi:hypothetical protein D3C87_1717050 [compost metagenome]